MNVFRKKTICDSERAGVYVRKVAGHLGKELHCKTNANASASALACEISLENQYVPWVFLIMA